MKKIRIGIICPSEIAFRRFVPAIRKCVNAEYVGVAHASAKEWFGDRALDASVIANEVDKAQSFVDTYGGKVYDSYTSLLTSNEVDAVYLPLPPALHFRWAKLALEHDKHVFLEKPSTIAAADTAVLVEMAAARGLALRENYMFVFHRQLDELQKIVTDGEIGDVRLYRIAFGFPQRAKTDFRYNRTLGGGALLDCGGYTLKLAGMLLGDTARVTCAQLNHTDAFDVDLYGSATLANDAGVTAQLSFGMDNSYKCELEIWGSKGIIRTGRIFTAPAGFTPTAEVTVGNETKTVTLSEDNTFEKSIRAFCQCVYEEEARKRSYRELLRQAELVETIKGG